MKKHEVKVGGEYIARVSDKLTHVRIDRENPHGGWDATNLATKKAVRIKSAQRLRAEVGRKAAPPAGRSPTAGVGPAAYVATGAKPAAESAKDAKPAPAATGGTPDATGAKPATADTKAAKLTTAEVKAAKAAAVAAKAAKPKGERKGGVLDAAVKVLQAAGKPMHCVDIIKEALAKGLWQTKGATPAATLYAAIIREVAAKATASRFRKTGRGLFELTAAARK